MTDQTKLGKHLDERVGQGNANLIRAFGRAYGALLLLADNGFRVLEADMGDDGSAALEIDLPTHEQMGLFEHIKRTPVSETNNLSEGWMCMAEIGGCEACQARHAGIAVWWHEPYPDGGGA
ncbi:hypothetical protein [Thiothrix nivea]|uniref:Uncharacterized protein n=1 Tax=Thiothrix nivea (strain ATCC 35100 / DSM 5205 / JP2) TaxID=870187 RepID=A0A656HD04_THINJ|nr:hypothetical protein [Thiothrix nivea]EIJ33340.1 hypothetical protein Thini_0703 [Thiothrix nivea DSM 5205]